jgi:hypothetical protein
MFRTPSAIRNRTIPMTLDMRIPAIGSLLCLPIRPLPGVRSIPTNGVVGRPGITTFKSVPTMN